VLIWLNGAGGRSRDKPSSIGAKAMRVALPIANQLAGIETFALVAGKVYFLQIGIH
jgi:hypothetical protein